MLSGGALSIEFLDEMIIGGWLPNNATYTGSVSRVDLLKLLFLVNEMVAIACELDVVIYIF